MHVTIPHPKLPAPRRWSEQPRHGPQDRKPRRNSRWREDVPLPPDIRAVAAARIRPRVIDYRQALPGDEHITRFRMTIIDTERDVHPGGLFQLTQALMDANKLFDLVLLPQTGHALPGYGMVRMSNYCARHLAGLEPPPGFIAKSSSDYLSNRAKALQMAAVAQPEEPSPERASADN